ncbi:hypothetical protein ACIQ1S_24040 [Streptomyces griseus]|uniref:hypothetical protein n=1 Tax=Streptomyces griseus TaxID=1911 RepID=UPI0038178B1B
MARLGLETEKALDTVRDRYGRTVHLSDAADIRTRRTRRALAEYRADLGESALPLLAAATQALHTMPPSAAVEAWHELIASLATSHGEIMRASTAPSEREASAVWVHLAHWADTGPIAAHLADLHHTPAPEFTADESRKWTERAQRARSRGGLDLFESWFSADGRRITLAYLVEDDDSEVVALAGDPDAPGWAVIGRYDNELDAGTALPRPMPPGVLRPEGTLRFNRPDLVHEVPLQELLRDVAEAHQAGDASNALLIATERGYEQGAMTQLQQLVQTAAAFSWALESVQGQRIGSRLDSLGRQLGFLADEVRDAAADLGATVAVLPPHRVPKPLRTKPRPAIGTSSPAARPSHTTANARRA